MNSLRKMWRRGPKRTAKRAMIRSLAALPGPVHRWAIAGMWALAGVLNRTAERMDAALERAKARCGL